MLDASWLSFDKCRQILGIFCNSFQSRLLLDSWLTYNLA
jgi:hypothetical protein